MAAMNGESPSPAARFLLSAEVAQSVRAFAVNLRRVGGSNPSLGSSIIIFQSVA
jgi:hypothetical protein